MKLVINACYGGFRIQEKYLKELNAEWSDEVERDDPRLIELLETIGKKIGGPYSELVIVEIPDEATDYEITEYDGFEGVIAVINGKIVHF